MARRWTAYGISVLFVIAVAWPGFTDRDSFPLSNYPMFSRDRGRVASFDTAVGVRRDGTTERLSPRRISGSYEVVLAAETVSKAIRNATADQLCREIAARSRSDDVVGVEVVTETFDTVAWFRGDETPIERVVHAECQVDR